MADTRLISLIQEDRPLDFNRAIEGISSGIDLSDGHFRAYDLRKFNLSQANLTNGYFRSADLRGLDLSSANLHGASFKDAKVSGVLFPSNISATELQLSIEHGTRIRAGGTP